jgi:hypothetical protein
MPHKLQSVTSYVPNPPNAWRPLSGAARGILASGRIAILVVRLAGMLVWAGFLAAVWLMGEWARMACSRWATVSRGGEHVSWSEQPLGSLLSGRGAAVGRGAKEVRGVAIPPPSPQTSGE